MVKLKLRVLWALLALWLGVVGGAAQPAERQTVRVMNFNIWRGGELVDFGKVVEAIQAAQADVVAIQEGETQSARLADALGWEHYSHRAQVISRYPLIDPPVADGRYVYVQLAPGQVFAVANLHLPSDSYGPYNLRDGMALEEALQIEVDTRVSMLTPILTQSQTALDAGIPLVMLGDFNSPSHLDWTEGVAAVNPQRPSAVPWPVTLAMETAGYRDAYRSVHPDPVTRPGNTWTYGYPVPRLRPDEMIDRIDMIFVAGAVDVLNAEIVGEAGGPDVDIPIAPFPSDHRGVVATLNLAPAEPPLFVAVTERAIRRGDELVVRYHAPTGEASDKIAIVAAGDDAPIYWQPPYEAEFFGSVTFGTATLPVGEYAVILLNEADEELSRSTFWVMEREALPAIRTEKASYAVGEDIRVTWENAPAYRWDWIGVYAAGDPDVLNGYYAFVYTNASVAGETTLTSELFGEPLPPGDYEVRLMRDDAYFVLASSPFTVGE